MPSEWAKERAEELADLGEKERHHLGFYARMSEAALVALDEAERRGVKIGKELSRKEHFVQHIATHLSRPR